MVDSMTIYHEFKKYRDYNKAWATLQKFLRENNSKRMLHAESNRCITYAFAPIGMEEIYFTENVKPRIYIKLRPKLMIDCGNYYNVLRSYDVPELYKEFKKHMKNIGFDMLPELRQWKVNRIDYAVDIVMNQEDIPAYIDLFKRGNITESVMKRFYTQKYMSSENNLYLENSSCVVNFYDRYTTVKLKSEHREKDYNVKPLFGVMRFEVQLRKINSTKLKKYGFIYRNCVDDFLNIRLCRYYILKYYTQLIGKGNYYAYNTALAKCRSSRQRDMIKLVHESGSIYNAKKQFIHNKDNKRKAEKQFSEIICKLNANGINPVTIESGFMENLYDKISYRIYGSGRRLIGRRMSDETK